MLSLKKKNEKYAKESKSVLHGQKSLFINYNTTIGSIWIPVILLKTENNKNKKIKVTVHARVTVHMPKCTVHVS